MSGYEFAHWADVIQQYGFPIIAMIGLGYFIWYVWKWVTKEVKPALGQAGGSLGKLKKQIQALDNDMIRLNMKLKILIQERNVTDKHKSPYCEEE
tara:strand:- start:313 stop:597 length:285 start_codon:yes stop_codon:yes gene_type:complete